MYRAMTMLAACALLVGCATSTTEKKEGAAVSKKVKKAPQELKKKLEPLSTPPGIRAPGIQAQTKKGGGASKEKIVTYKARFDIDRLAGSKRFQGSALYLDDGTTLLASYRPMKEYFHLVDRRVVAKGFHWSPPAHAQQIMASHFTITEMSLDPSASPVHATKPTQLPAPPAVRTGKELAARDGRWVRVIGKLRGGKKEKSGSWGHAELTLADGALAEASVFWSTYEREWKPLVGQGSRPGRSGHGSRPGGGGRLRGLVARQ